jgi:GDPmannose 4,6-dehydratase
LAARRALITGISGQDGSYLAELLVEKGYEVFGVVRGPATAIRPNLQGIREELRLIEGDLRDEGALSDAIEQSEPDELYNLAAGSFVPASWDQAAETIRFAATGATTMLEVARRNRPEMRVFQASSSEIFGATRESPQTEATPCVPQNPYAVAKLCGHLMVGAYRQRYGVHASSGILYNHESPRRPIKFVTGKVTRGAAAISLGLASELRLGDLDAVRDWSFAGDVAQAMWLALQHDFGDDYVIASGVGRTVRQLVECAFGYVDLDPVDYLVVDPEFVRPREPVPLVGDPTRVRERLGWTPTKGFESMVAEMVEADLRALRCS